MIFSFQPYKQSACRKILLSLLILAAALLQISCNDSDDEPSQPEFSPIPFIELDKVEIKLGEDNRDTISITVNYQDGDANLGLDRRAADNDTLFQEVYYITTDQDTVSTLNDKVIRFGAPDQPEFNIWDWHVDFDYGQQQYDTLRVVYNENYYNIYLDMYVKKPGEEYEKIDFEQLNRPFGVFNAIFPPITNQPLTNPGSPYIIVPESLYNGKLTYNLINSFRFAFDLGKDTFKFRLFIKDRALNKSNVIETPGILFE